MQTSPFIPDQIYRRQEFQQQYGGNPQGGIAASAKFPYIFIFTGASGQKHGYEDNWDNENVFSYTGEGQVGDMKFVRGNLALRDHLENGKRVFLFEYVSRGYVKFVSEVEVIHINYFLAKDRNGDAREAIRFFFKRKGVYLPKEADLFIGQQKVAEPIPLYQLNIPNETERKGLVTSRVGQGAYRMRIIHRWEYHCAVTGFSKPEILIASHIKPWREASNEERLDVNNGILLSPVYDALFDRHLISFENTGKIILSDQIAFEAYQKLGVSEKDTIKKLNRDNFIYLEEHRRQLRGI